MRFLTVEEFAEMLRVEREDILSLIEEGVIRAVRIGTHLRIRESELTELETRCPAVESIPPLVEKTPLPKRPTLSSDKWRIAYTITGKEFRVDGSLKEGFQIWPGKMSSPIRFPREFLPALLTHFAGQQKVAVGGQFDNVGNNTLGEFIQGYIKTRMNPAVYVRALLIEEGYATEAGKGYLRFAPQPGEDTEDA